MAELSVSESRPASGGKTAVGRLFVLELNAGLIHTMNPDGSEKKTIVTDCRLPDGIAVDVAAGHIYWTNMGNPPVNDGSIERADLDGKNRKVIVPQGVIFTPKQMHLDKENGKLYWCDREGMRVMRANLDGSQVETLVETGRGDNDRQDQSRWCVGITIDLKRRHIYWTQKGPDNGDPPRGNTVNRAPIDKKATPEIVVTHLMEGIGITLDVPGNRMFVTDFAGSIYSADLDGKNERNFLYAQGNLTGIAYAEI